MIKQNICSKRDFHNLKTVSNFLINEEMNWNNLELDHIQTLSSFKLSDINQLKQAAHYTNIQPSLSEDNRSKSDRVHEQNFLSQSQKLYEYERYNDYFYLLKNNFSKTINETHTEKIYPKTKKKITIMRGKYAICGRNK